MAKRVEMVPRSFEVTQRHAASVTVKVLGEVKVENHVRVLNADFTGALCDAIGKSQVFAHVAETTADGYSLEVTVVGYGPPRAGFNMTASLTTNWKLMRLPNNEVVFEDFIKKQHTCTVGDAFAGATRWRKTNEGVVRDIISEGIQRLSQLKL